MHGTEITGPSGELDTTQPPHAISLLGIPLELGAGTPGALMGPAALRTAGLPDILGALGHRVIDHGDVQAPTPTAMAALSLAMTPDNIALCRHPHAIAAWTRALHDRAYELAGHDGTPVFMGGDHALSMGTVSGIARHCAEQGKELAVLWLDAHADFNTPSTSPSGNMHGMPVAFLTGEPSLQPLLGERRFAPLRPEQVHIVGLRSIDSEERRRVAVHGIDCIDMRRIDEFGVAAPVRAILDGLAGRDVHLHVSFDVDFLDPSIAPAVGTTVPGGATYREAHLIMEMLHDSGLLGSLDIVELNPFLDERGRTARVATEIVASLFGRTVLDRHPARVQAG